MSWIKPWSFGVKSGDCFEVVADIQAFKALRDDWDDLGGRSSQHRFSQSFVWCWTTWEAVEAPRGRQLHCIVGRNRGRIVLIWPFIVHRKCFPFVGAPLGCSYTEYPDPLVEDGPEADQRVEGAWQTLRDTCGCDLINLRFVREESKLHHLVGKMGRRARVISRVANHHVTWRDHENWESYYGSLPNKDRSENGRRRRQLEDRGKVTFEVITGTQCSPAIDWALANKVEQLARTNRRGGEWLKTRAYRDLLVGAASRSSPHGRVVVFALKLDDQIIATLVSRVDKVRVEGLNTVYDATYSGAGRILLGAVLEWAFEQQLELDMRGGNEPYKRRVSNQKCMVMSYEIANTKLYKLCLLSPALMSCVRRYRRGIRGLNALFNVARKPDRSLPHLDRPRC